jgi:hypothetical protein
VYRKVIVMEVKEEYALAMTKDGQIIRIQKKEGIKVGDCIYILDEDLHEKKQQEKENICCTKESKRKKISPIWKQLTAVAAAAVVFIVALVSMRQPGKAYAMVTVDSVKTVQLKLDQKNRVKEILSEDGSLKEEEAKTLIGKNIEAAEEYLTEKTSTGETAIIGYAWYQAETDQEREAMERCLERIFGTENVLYLGGSRKDIEAAGKEQKSLGIYLAEQAVTGEDLNSLQKDMTEKELLQLLKKQPALMENEICRKALEKAWSVYEDPEEESEEEEEETEEQSEEEDREEAKGEEYEELEEEDEEKEEEREFSSNTLQGNQEIEEQPEEESGENPEPLEEPEEMEEPELLEEPEEMEEPEPLEEPEEMEEPEPLEEPEEMEEPEPLEEPEIEEEDD